MAACISWLPWRIKTGTIIPKIKISENVAKITTPCFKSVWRLFDKETGKAIADVITLHDEVIDDEHALCDCLIRSTLWKRKTVENFTAVPLATRRFSKSGRMCV